MTENELNAIVAKLADRLSVRFTSPWMSIGEACQYARMSKNTLMACIDKGDIRAGKRPVGGWIVNHESIDNYNEGADSALFNDIARRCGL